jgi:hypothetical protein
MMNILNLVTSRSIGSLSSSTRCWHRLFVSTSSVRHQWVYTETCLFTFIRECPSDIWRQHIIYSPLIVAKEQDDYTWHKTHKISQAHQGKYESSITITTQRTVRKILYLYCEISMELFKYLYPSPSNLIHNVLTTLLVPNKDDRYITTQHNVSTIRLRWSCSNIYTRQRQSIILWLLGSRWCAFFQFTRFFPSHQTFPISCHV